MLLAPPVVPFPEPLRWEWDGDQYNLLRGRVQVGALNDGGYRPRVGPGWGEPCEPPVAPPPGAEARRKCRCGAPCCDCKNCRCRPDRKCCPDCRCGRRGAEQGQGPAQNFGVNSEQLPEGETFSINGRAVSGDAIKRLIGKGGELADDTHKWRLTVVGSKEECDRVLADLEHSAALAPWKDRLLVQAYRPGSWAVKEVGFPTDGHPRIVVQGPPEAAGKGPVLWDQPDYRGGAEQLAQGLTQARRMADPNYDPSKDPGPGRRPSNPAPSRPSVPDSSLQPGHIMPCCVAAVLLTLTVALAIRRKQ
jgi:hypothetical protein